VVDDTCAIAQQFEMAVHGVLVEWNEDVELVTHVADGTLARADGQERVATANQGLISIVGVQVQTPPRKDARENISGSCDALSGFTADADCKINCSHLIFLFL